MGGEKFLCEASSRPQVKASTKDSHFTVLGFTAATGKAVMCAIIFSAIEMCESWVLGCNSSAPWVGNENDIRANTGGIDKRYPQGPVCHFNGKTIPTFCCCSETAASRLSCWQKCFATWTALMSLIGQMVLTPFLFLTVTAVALSCHSCGMPMIRRAQYKMEPMCGCAIWHKLLAGW